VHPAQLYAAIDAALLATLAIAFTPLARKDGEVFALVLTLHPISRLLLEAIRVDEPPALGTPLSISQLVSLGLLAIAGGLWWWLGGQPPSQPARQTHDRSPGQEPWQQASSPGGATGRRPPPPADSLTIRCRERGPLVVEMPTAARFRDLVLRVTDHLGHEFPLPTGTRAVALCRCGQSRSRPFCDGSHKECGFDGAETAPPGGGPTG
jgi:CDGSH-type Zn-finger protein